MTRILSKLKWAGLALLTSAALAPARPTQDPPKAGAPPAIGPKPEAKSRAPDPVALMVPRSLLAVGGVGLALMYALDPKGERIPDPTTRAFREVEVDLRWVAITGLLDDQAVREANTLAGEAGPFVGAPEYRRVDVERQVRGPGGDWSDWSRIDVDKNYQVLDNLPEVTPERLPKAVLPLALVDTLPVLRQGRWDGVDPEGLLGLVAPGTEKAPAGGVPVVQPPRLAVRSLDFTVEPGKTYRYRLRVVTRMPVVPRPVPRKDEIRPGDGRGVVPPPERPGLVSGPWSEATGAVEVP